MWVDMVLIKIMVSDPGVQFLRVYVKKLREFFFITVGNNEKRLY